MKKIIYSLLISLVLAGGFLIFNHIKSRLTTSTLPAGRHDSQLILYYTCGMHPSVRVSPQEYEKGSKLCPICNMGLTPIYKQTPKKVQDVSKDLSITLDKRQRLLAGIKTFQVKILPLFKEIKTVGVVAYDPKLRTAQEEYIQAVKTYSKVSQSGFSDAKQRAMEIITASENKLKLMGFTQELIGQMMKNGSSDNSLILPSQSMWIYADIYEYESIWPQVGGKAKIISEADPSIEFIGEVKAIEPIIKEKTRTLQLKILVENKQKFLKPNMYTDVYLKISLGDVLAIPKEAVLDTGKRKLVYVEVENNKFLAKEVIVGPDAQSHIEGVKQEMYPLIKGLKQGQKVVVKGNFLIDSQSQLGAASSAYGGALESEAGTQHMH